VKDAGPAASKSRPLGPERAEALPVKAGLQREVAAHFLGSHRGATAAGTVVAAPDDVPGGEIDALKMEKEARRKLEAKGPRIARLPTSEAAPEEGTKVKKALSKGKSEHRAETEEALANQVAESRALLAARGEDRAKAVPAKDEGSEAKRAESDRAKTGSRDDPGLAARIQVSDLRRAQAKKEAAAPVDSTEAPAAKKTEDSRAKAEISLDLARSQGAPPADKSLDARPDGAVAKSNDFAAVLAERLRDSGNTEIVQSARIILKDGDSGTIRMRLNPPELGKVKIELNLADNSISGKIIVESDAAKNAFEKGLADLQDAFRSGGFESAKLEVSVGSGDAGGAGARQDGGAAPFWSERSRSLAFDRVPSLASYASRADRAVDIIV